jgi:hypothetical protein
MKTLTIKDLARTEQLDRGAMALVRGGWSMNSAYCAPSCAPSCSPSYKMGDLNYAPNHDSSISATQNLLQKQSVATLTANDSAFLDGVSVHSDVHQNGQNKIIG